MKTNKLLALTLIIAITLTALYAGTATAITGNTEPNTKPYVGVVVLFADEARTQPIGYCSGFLIAPKVMITAGHSLIGTQAVSVCFDKGPISYDVQDGKLVYYGTETIYNGNPVTYPEYYPTLAGNKEIKTSVGIFCNYHQILIPVFFHHIGKEHWLKGCMHNITDHKTCYL
jgi:hypothetical protein